MTKRASNPSEPSQLLPSLPSGADVLIIRLRSLGDVVMLTPALTALHGWRPDLRLSVLVEPALAPLLEGNPAVAQLIPFRGFFSAARELRRRAGGSAFPVTYNQHAGPTSALLTAAVGSPARVCWAGTQFAFLYNVRVPGPEAFYGPQKVHTVEHRLTQFYWTGLPRGPIPPARVYPQQDAAQAVRNRLSAHGLAADERYAVLHPGAAYFTKRWAIENFAVTARWLRETRGLRPVTVLGPGDGVISAAVCEELSPHSLVFDSLSLRELIALIAGAQLFLGNDSGPAHVASATGCPAAVIFGSSDSVTWRPWQATHHIVQNDFPCNPCRGDRCYAFEEPRCILSITPDQVQAACASLLDASSEAPASRDPHGGGA